MCRYWGDSFGPLEVADDGRDVKQKKLVWGQSFLQGCHAHSSQVSRSACTYAVLLSIPPKACGAVPAKLSGIRYKWASPGSFSLTTKRIRSPSRRPSAVATD